MIKQYWSNSETGLDNSLKFSGKFFLTLKNFFLIKPTIHCKLISQQKYMTLTIWFDSFEMNSIILCQTEYVWVRLGPNFSHILCHCE